MSDTPETDDLARGNHVVPTEWAEQLEIERNEAIRQRDETNESSVFSCNFYYEEKLKAERELAEAREARNECERQFQEKVCEIAQLLSERDEAREELKKLEGAYADATNYYARMIELREELDQVKEELKNKTYDKLKS